MLEILSMGMNDPAQRDSCRAKIAQYGKEITRYDNEKQDAMDQARGYEKKRVDFQADSAIFGLAVVYLQVAIVFSGLAALLKKKPVWLLGLAVGTFGVFSFANGFLHFLH